MTLPRSSRSSRPSSTLSRTNSDIGMAGNQSPQPPLSSCEQATSLNMVTGNHPATRGPRWLPHILPIEALEATLGDKTVTYLQYNGRL